MPQLTEGADMNRRQVNRRQVNRRQVNAEGVTPQNVNVSPDTDEDSEDLPF